MTMSGYGLVKRAGPGNRTCVTWKSDSTIPYGMEGKPVSKDSNPTMPSHPHCESSGGFFCLLWKEGRWSSFYNNDQGVKGAMPMEFFTALCELHFAPLSQEPLCQQ